MDDQADQKSYQNYLHNVAHFKSHDRSFVPQSAAARSAFLSFCSPRHHEPTFLQSGICTVGNLSWLSLWRKRVHRGCGRVARIACAQEVAAQINFHIILEVHQAFIAVVAMKDATSIWGGVVNALHTFACRNLFLQDVAFLAAASVSVFGYVAPSSCFRPGRHRYFAEKAKCWPRTLLKLTGKSVNSVDTVKQRCKVIPHHKFSFQHRSSECQRFYHFNTVDNAKLWVTTCAGERNELGSF